jgi:hypothetical protein
LSLDKFTPFDRLIDSSGIFSYIGSGSIGGKAQGLAFIKDALINHADLGAFRGLKLGIPALTVITTDVFEQFMRRNNLYDIALSDRSDDEIAKQFIAAHLPPNIVEDLRVLSRRIRRPLAIRSSSLFEDAMHEPFAGVYETKMIPNNQLDSEARFRALLEAVKFVYASTFFKGAKEYIKTTGQTVENERMAVIIQEIVGNRFGDRFYPHISGVARSYNFYRTGNAKPEDGVVDLALGLGKTVVDGGKTWNYSPAYPNAIPPYKDLGDMMKSTQTEFWAVNMGEPAEYNPITETEYLVNIKLGQAEKDGVLTNLVSTYDSQNDKLVIGMTSPGPRLLTFAPILDLGQMPLNDMIKHLLQLCEEVTGHQVEMEFAVTLNNNGRPGGHFGLLQVRPMFVSRAVVKVELEELEGPQVLLATEDVLGNGVMNNISDVVYLKGAGFTVNESRLIASELEAINHQLTAEGAQYLLIVFGRLGTIDPPFGIPVDWWQVSGAKVIVEAWHPEMNVELSQGSHFFHNVISSQVGYFSLPHLSRHTIDWEWLNRQPEVLETQFVRHIKLAAPLQVKIDGAQGRGVIYHG